MIPFNKPVHLGTEILAMAEAIERNGHVAGGGPFGKRSEARLEQMLGQRTLLVTSATHALEMAALLLDIQPGDEFIVPSFTFVSTANAFCLRGAKPVFADVDAHGNLDVSEVERLLGPRTKAVVPVHYAGNSCDMQALAQVCGKVPVVEDAAQALGATFDGRPLGTFGACGAFSFHETKNIGCGEGGALSVRDASLIDRAEYLRDKGTNRRKFQDGIVDKYTWVDVGSSYVLSDLNAAYLSTQLDEFARIQARRKVLYSRYLAELSAPIERAGAYIIQGSARCVGNQHLFAIVFRAPEQRGRFIAHMREHKIIAPFHYIALHQAPMGKSFHDGRSLPHSERLTTSLVRLPLFFNMTDAECDTVIARTREFLDGL
jgi:dTDP-4-amino-4,6-dideoxygalactose transaminase